MLRNNSGHWDKTFLYAWKRCRNTDYKYLVLECSASECEHCRTKNSGEKEYAIWIQGEREKLSESRQKGMNYLNQERKVWAISIHEKGMSYLNLGRKGWAISIQRERYKLSESREKGMSYLNPGRKGWAIWILGEKDELSKFREKEMNYLNLGRKGWAIWARERGRNHQGVLFFFSSSLPFLEVKKKGTNHKDILLI